LLLINRRRRPAGKLLPHLYNCRLAPKAVTLFRPPPRLPVHSCVASVFIFLIFHLIFNRVTFNKFFTTGQADLYFIPFRFRAPGGPTFNDRARLGPWLGAVSYSRLARRITMRFRRSRWHFDPVSFRVFSLDAQISIVLIFVIRLCVPLQWSFSPNQYTFLPI